MHVEKRDLVARESVVLLPRSRERREIDRADTLREGPILGRELEPINQRRRRGQRLPMNHVFAAEPDAESKPHEQLGMRRTAGNPARLLFVEALSQLDPFLRVGASRMQRAQRPRKLTHLQKKLGRKTAQPILRNFALCDSMPNGMAP